MKRILTAFAATTIALSAPGAPAFAQAAPAEMKVGMQVVDTQGNPVGAVAETDANFITVKTDKHMIPVPVASFTPHEGKLLFGMSAPALNASYEKALADTEASVSVGKAVVDVEGAAVGTIDEITDDYVQLELASGKVVRLPTNGLQKDPNGAIALYKVADLQAQAVERPETAAEEAVEAAEMAEEAAEQAVKAAEKAADSAKVSGAN